LATLAGKWKTSADYFQKCGYDVPPALIVVAANTALSELIEQSLKRGDIIRGTGRRLRFPHRLESARRGEAVEGGTKEEAAERLR